MTTSSTFDSQRSTALAAIERQQTLTKAAIFAAVAVEGVLLIAILATIDFSNTLERLVFLSAALAYLPLALGMMALAALVNRQARSILLALHMLSEEREG